jgi:hypothetical protein
MSGYRGAKLLLTALSKPSSMTDLSLADWEALIQAARQTRLLARLHWLLQQDTLLNQLPKPVINQLHNASVITCYHQRRARWELNRLQRVLSPHRIPLVLLKGGAYLMLDLEIAHGREMRDVDLLIPRNLIDQAELVLYEQGWGSSKMDDYDQRYYRDWMHELPPMRHVNRVTEVDLHHTILPRTSRLHPDPARLFQAATQLAPSGLGVLCAHDRVLHSAVHLFYDGALDRDLRDLVDLDSLFRESAADPDFWPGLVTRAEELELERPLYYALHFSEQLLNTPIPLAVKKQARRHAPGVLARWLMNHLVPLALLPSDPRHRHPMAGSARWLLYLRSHWLRMPPLMLARHLFHKGVISKPHHHLGLF